MGLQQSILQKLLNKNLLKTYNSAFEKNKRSWFINFQPFNFLKMKSKKCHERKILLSNYNKIACLKKKSHSQSKYFSLEKSMSLTLEFSRPGV